MERYKLNYVKMFFLKIESFFDPKRIEIYHISYILSVDYNVVLSKKKSRPKQ